MTDPNCIFCKIVAGELPATIVYRDDATVAFMDINPATDGHCLIVTREHAVTIFDLSEGAAASVMKAALRIAPALKEALKPDGLNLFQSNGKAAFQTVDHFHLHLIPRWGGDGIRLPWIPRPGDSSKIGGNATKIISALEASGAQ
jgi:histidine triad (HIT) family protein